MPYGQVLIHPADLQGQPLYAAARKINYDNMAPLPQGLIDKLRKGEVIPFVGSGVSRAVTDSNGKPLFPSWPELLARAVERLHARPEPQKSQPRRR